MIRVLRLMEYEYPDAKTMEDHMSRWYVPPIGTKTIGIGKVSAIRSTILTDLNYEGEDATPTVD